MCFMYIWFFIVLCKWITTLIEWGEDRDGFVAMGSGVRRSGGNSFELFRFWGGDCGRKSSLDRPWPEVDRDALSSSLIGFLIKNLTRAITIIVRNLFYVIFLSIIELFIQLKSFDDFIKNIIDYCRLYSIRVTHRSREKCKCFLWNLTSSVGVLVLLKK